MLRAYQFQLRTCCLQLLVFLTLVLLSTCRDEQHAFPIARYSVSNKEAQCFEPIRAAQPGNWMTFDDFPKFIALLSKANNVYDPSFNTTTFGELPSQILIMVNRFVCAGSTECPSGISTDTNNTAQMEKLEEFCEEIVDKMKLVLNITDSPTISPTSDPSANPSRNPTTSPSRSPSESPSRSPTLSPSVSPSKVPTISPTKTISERPSKTPTSQPTEAPSVSPTVKPTKDPSRQPSSPPGTNPPSQIATSSPTITPTQSPTIETVPVGIPFGIVNMYGLTASQIIENSAGVFSIIITTFAEFAEEIERDLYEPQSIGGNGRTRSMMSRNDRRLADFSPVTFVTNIQDLASCPPEILKDFKNMSPEPLCQKMDGVINFSASPEANIEGIKRLIRARAEEHITNDMMTNKVPETIRSKIVFFSLQNGQVTYSVITITSLAIGAALVGLIAGRLMVSKRVRGKGRNNQYDGIDGILENGGGSGEMTMDEDEYGSNPRGNHSPASTSSYKGLAEQALYNGDDEDDDDERDRAYIEACAHDMSLESSIASSSNAGSSGWSSSAGVSSMNTGSIDSVEYFGSSLAAIGAASVISKRYNDRSSNNREGMYQVSADISESSMSESDLGASGFETDDDSQMTPGQQHRQFAVKEELDAAIKNGDWSLVGATAAIIAQSPGDFLTSDGISTLSSGIDDSIDTIQSDNERVVELERLVTLGDWEGVVLAAAKYEAENEKDGATEGSASISEGQRFLGSRGMTHQGDAYSTNSPSVSTNFSGSASHNRKRDELRREVHDLVCKVVPDEIDNVDEMMHQFAGREEELVETLRTMQERSIAARQREAMRRNAKREARKLAKQKKLPPSGRPPVNTSISQDRSFASNATSNNNLSFHTAASNQVDTDGPSNNLTPRAALDHAIQIGDWEAVGKTAEQLGEGSVSEASEYHSVDETSTLLSAQTQSTNPDAERVAELECLIDEGDWSGVVAAASRYTANDVKKRSPSRKRNTGAKEIINDNKESSSCATESSWKLPLLEDNKKSGPPDDTVSQSTEVKKQKTLKEEEDALAQADIWMTIAAQSKSEPSNATQGASDAADWAISRSLKQIEASSSHDKQETQSVASSCDDKSV